MVNDLKDIFLKIGRYKKGGQITTSVSSQPEAGPHRAEKISSADFCEIGFNFQFAAIKFFIIKTYLIKYHYFIILSQQKIITNRDNKKIIKDNKKNI